MTSQTSQTSDIVLSADNVKKELTTGEVVVHALRGVSLEVKRGELLGIIGPSGSGKSTLLGIIGGLDSPTSGTVHIDGTDITAMTERALTRVRNQKIGFVFQSFNLIPTLTALENVALPIQFSAARKHSPVKRARELLDMLGLGDRMKHRPTQLSGGQKQRVAIARALANDPPILLADEPTGNLDSESSEVVMKALHDIRVKNGTTVIIVSHDMDVASQLDRLIHLVDGQISADMPTGVAAARPPEAPGQPEGQPDDQAPDAAEASDPDDQPADDQPVDDQPVDDQPVDGQPGSAPDQAEES